MTEIALGYADSSRCGVTVCAVRNGFRSVCHKDLSQSQVSGVAPASFPLSLLVAPACSKISCPRSSGTGSSFLETLNSMSALVRRQPEVFLQEDKDHLIPMPLN